MELETTISKNIRAADRRAQYDEACKRLLSEKIVLAWIMKECVEEYQACDVVEIAEKYIEGEPQISEVAVNPDETNAGSMIHGTNSEDVTITEGVITYDIRFFALLPGSGERIRLIINVEAQNRFYPGYPLLKRGVYYCSRMISAQHGTEFTGSHYEKIKKVYSIWICTHPPRHCENSITSYSIQEKNLIGNVKEKRENYDLLSVIIICLGGAEREGEGRLLKLLNTLLSSEIGQAEKRKILQEDFEIPMTQRLESEVSLMCNLSEGVLELGWRRGWEEGQRKGQEEGRNQGLEEGRNQGLEEGVLSSIQNLMETLNLTIEQAMSALKISESDRPKFRAMLEQ